MKKYLVCTTCFPHHIENCDTCFGFGVFKNSIPINASYVSDGKRKCLPCPECGSTLEGLTSATLNTIKLEDK